jgi:hypothetical protein
VASATALRAAASARLGRGRRGMWVVITVLGVR